MRRHDHIQVGEMFEQLGVGFRPIEAAVRAFDVAIERRVHRIDQLAHLALPVPVGRSDRVVGYSGFCLFRGCSTGVVEATGVEPVSEKTPTKASTSLARTLFSQPRTLPSKITAVACPDRFPDRVEVPAIGSRLV